MLGIGALAVLHGSFLKDAAEASSLLPASPFQPPTPVRLVNVHPARPIFPVLVNVVHPSRRAAEGSFLLGTSLLGMGALKVLHGPAEARSSRRGPRGRCLRHGLGFRVQGLGFMVYGLGFRVWGLGFRV